MEMAGEILGQLLRPVSELPPFGAVWSFEEVLAGLWYLRGSRLGRVSGGHGSLSDADHRDLRGERGFDDAVALSGDTAESADDPLSGMRHLPACAWSGRSTIPPTTSSWGRKRWRSSMAWIQSRWRSQSGWGSERHIRFRDICLDGSGR